MVEAPTMDAPLPKSKHKAIATLLPYAVHLEKGGEQEMVDAIVCAANACGLILGWPHVRAHVAALFNESSPPSLNRAITLMSPHIPWHFWLSTEGGVIRWAAAALAVEYSEEVCQSVVNTLLQISRDDSQRLLVPDEIWAWLKKQPSLPPLCPVRSYGSQGPIVLHVRALGDIEILKAYLLLVWSEWDYLWISGFEEMEVLIREDFGGIEMWCHRDDLTKHLDHIQGELGRGLEYFKQYYPHIDEHNIKFRKEQYKHLGDVLLGVDKGAMETLTRMCPRLIFSPFY